MQLRHRSLFTGFVIFFIGVVVGGYLFSHVQPRSILNLSRCQGNCYRPNDVAGLLTSVGIRVAPGMMPKLVTESDRCLAISHPFPEAGERFHFVIFPKKDIKNIGEISVEDEPYLMDCLAMMQSLIVRYQLRDYRVMTNGPGLQQITYLHFHLTTPSK
jgi:hypothetical protein